MTAVLEPTDRVPVEPPGEPKLMIEARGVTKAFGDNLALDQVDLQVRSGSVLGLLGPNGSGKTTLVRILTTLLEADSGEAKVAGFDVKREAVPLRSMIGLAGQYAAVDEILTGRENLELVGLLYHLSRAERKHRAADTLQRLGLADAADRLVRTYSGGMRRRLDLGASLVGRPKVLILDEPTTGLDPATRIDLWRFIQMLVADGTTVLLTTQYLDEVDRLADRIVVIDHGRVIAEGTSNELKDQLGGAVLELTVANHDQLEMAASLIAGLGRDQPVIDKVQGRVTLKADDNVKALLEAARRLDDRGVQLEDIGLRSLPMARSAVLAGRTLADLVRNVFVVLLMVGVGIVVGFRFHGSIGTDAGGLALVLLFGYAFSWVFVAVGLYVRDPETAQIAGFLPLFPLVFASSAFVPVTSMPRWLQAFANVQPVSVCVDAVRAMVDGGPLEHWLWQALAWAFGILVFFALLGIRQYRDI